jgi:hypothetical protein
MHPTRTFFLAAITLSALAALPACNRTNRDSYRNGGSSMLPSDSPAGTTDVRSNPVDKGSFDTGNPSSNPDSPVTAEIDEGAGDTSTATRESHDVMHQYVGVQGPGTRGGLHVTGTSTGTATNRARAGDVEP